MTEIPEHLLKRSKERRAAMGLSGGEGDAPAAASSETSPTPVAAAAAPVAARAATPEPAPPPPPKPEPAYVRAARTRRRIPFWAMPIIPLLPLWGLLYWNSVRVPPVQDAGLIDGAAVYNQQACGSCHGATGGGGAGPQLSAGDVLKTFKNPEDMMMWIYLGAVNGARPDGTYGDADRPGGPHNVNTFPAVMPAHTSLTPQQLADVTRYVRETLSGEAETPAQIANYPTLGQDAINQAKAGVLPSAETVKKGSSTTTTPSGG